MRSSSNKAHVPTIHKRTNYASDLVTQVEEGIGKLPGVIKRHPGQSMLVGFGVGLGVAFLLNRLIPGKAE